MADLIPRLDDKCKSAGTSGSVTSGEGTHQGILFAMLDHAAVPVPALMVHLCMLSGDRATSMSFPGVP